MVETSDQFDEAKTLEELFGRGTLQHKSAIETSKYVSSSMEDMIQLFNIERDFVDQSTVNDQTKPYLDMIDLLHK